MNTQAPRPSPYAPASANSLRLASATIEAVDRIGWAASVEVEKAADDIICGANEVADDLRKLATAIREHSKVASVHVSDFCNTATTVMESIRDLQHRFLGGRREAGAEETEDDKLPRGIGRGPADSNGHGL
jgi:hypothetical protein